MGGNKPLNVWRTATVDNTPLVESSEVGETSLQKLFDKYLAKAKYLQALSFQTTPVKPRLVTAIRYYLLAAESIRMLRPAIFGSGELFVSKDGVDVKLASIESVTYDYQPPVEAV